MDRADARLLVQLYRRERAVVRVGDTTNERVNIEREVKQDCVLSHDLFLCTNNW